MVDDLLRDLAKFGRHEEVGLSHPDIEERNITGISASVLPERFDLKARREARLKAEREAALFSMPPTDVPPRVRQLVVGVGLVCFIGALVAANFASTSSATTLMVLSMIGAGAVAVAMPAGTKRVWISRVVFILAAVSLVYVIDPTGLVRLSAARGRLEGATPGTREAAARELVGSGERDFTGVDLTNADLTELDLAGATFDGADLQSADFSGSDLNQATFVGADIRAATFDDANLTEVDLTLAEGLAEAYCNRGTYLPRGLRCQTNLLAVAQEN
jgi:hypothetical protein